jgi:hypothetical protein
LRYVDALRRYHGEVASNEVEYALTLDGVHNTDTIYIDSYIPHPSLSPFIFLIFFSTHTATLELNLPILTNSNLWRPHHRPRGFVSLLRMEL